MGNIAWDSTPTSGDCFNTTTWANMVQYIKHSNACVFTIYDDNASTSQKFKFSYAGIINTFEGDDTTGSELTIKATSADTYPKIRLFGADGTWIQNTAGFSISFMDALVRMFRFNYAANVSTLRGGDTTGDDLKLQSNSADTYPYISLDGNSHTSINIGSAKYLYINENAAQLFLFAREGNYSDIIGHSTTGKNMRLKANIADDYPRVDLIGNSAIHYFSHNDHYFYADAINQMKITGSADCNILGPSGTGADLILTANQTDAYPTIRLYGNDAIYLNTHTDVIIQRDATQAFRFSYDANLSTMHGGNVYGDDLKIRANANEAYPYISLLGGSVPSINTGSGVAIRMNEGGSYLVAFTRDGNYSKITGSDLTGKGFVLKANDADTYPKLTMVGNAYVDLQMASGSPFTIFSAADSAIKMMGSGTNGYIYGPAATGKTLYIYANATDAHPYISLGGLGDLNLNVDTYVRGYDINSGQIFKIGRTGDTSLYYGTSTTGGVLTFKASDIDTYPYITMTGNADMQLRVNTGNPIHMYDATTNMARILMSGTHTYIYGPAATLKNLTLTANYADTYPVLTLDGANGNIDTYLRAGGNLKIKDAANLIFKFELSGNYSKLTGQDVTTKSMQIQANSFETYPRILMEGNASINNYIAAASSFNIYDATTRIFTAQHGGGEAYWAGKTTTGGYLHIRACDANGYPNINMKGNDWIHLNTHTSLTIQQDAVQAFYFNYGANSSSMYGGGTTGDRLNIYANTVDAAPQLTLVGLGEMRACVTSGQSIKFYDGSTVSHKFSYAANVSKHEGGHTTGDDLILKANDTDTRPYILMKGADYMYFDVDSTYKYYFAWNGFSHLQFSYTSPDISIDGGTADKNIFIHPTGTGLVKFGTYAATGDTASNGYITILDAAGNTRKLMTCA